VSELAGVVVAGAVALAIVVAFVWWLVEWGRSGSDDARAHHVRAAELAGDVRQRDALVADLQQQRDRAYAARKVAEEAAHRAIARLARLGTSADLVDSLNTELRALATLSELSAPAAGASAADRDLVASVHDAAPAAGGSGHPPAGGGG
jgi:hypothetical protein